MNKKIFLGAMVGLLTGYWAQAGEFKVYPGAQLDEKTTALQQELLKAAGKADSRAQMYATKDSFEKVTNFYRNLGREIIMPNSSGTKGKPKKYENYDLWEAYFVVDDAKNLATSKRWIKVQRPYLGGEEGDQIIDATGILLMEKK